jgi:pyridoxine 5''-phosphate synthase
MQITQFSVNPVTFAVDTLNANLGNLFYLNAIIPANYSFLAEKVGRFLIYRKSIMTKLSVNINKVATIRNARGGNTPNVTKVALDCETFGAEGITVHPRPDERHIRRADVYEMRPLLKTEFNIEGYPSPEFIELVLQVKPHQVTLVPDDPSQITSNSGWDTKANLAFLTEVLDRFTRAGIRTSVFVAADVEMVEYAAKAGADRVELYTEPYATLYPKDPEAAIAPFLTAAKTARSLGLGLNAGHDLSLVNLNYLYKNIPWIDEVSIGHALISDALYLGLEKTIQEYKNCLR